jgi:hypothetical protein
MLCMDDLILWSLECQHTTKSNFKGNKNHHTNLSKIFLKTERRPIIAEKCIALTE